MVQGIVSAIRDVDKREMIQVAMPIEFGNSGGPLVDLQGNVHGIINMKSAIEDRVGFAIPIERLRELRAAPNPVAIERWTRLGRINPDHWTPLANSDWQQQSGRIQAKGGGDGFGGRSLCLSLADVPKRPFEVAVDVRLNDPTGAAGLIFHSDGKDRHYGFYPSNGKLRLSCFLGPSVFSWQVLQEIDSPFYLPGQWNRLRVLVTEETIECFVNGERVMESKDRQLSDGKVGLAAFRGTEAEFRRFRVGEPSADEQLSDSARSLISEMLADPQRMHTISVEELRTLAGSSQASVQEMTRRAIELQRRADQLKNLAEDVRRVPVLTQLRALLDEQDDDDLFRGALLIAALDNPDLDVDAYQERVDQMAREIRKELDGEASEASRLSQLDAYLFQQNGFHGGRDEYYHPANSHLNRVIDDREGLPITMSILYMELGRRLGLNIEGVGLPGHFVVRYINEEGDQQLIDVFDRARRMSKADAMATVLQYAQRLIEDNDLRPQSTEEILVRVLRNLIGSATRQRDPEAILRYVEALVAIVPEEGEYRMMRAAARHQTNRDHAALEDLDWLIEHRPPGININEVRQMRDFLKP
ncbi:MAG: transglutaminase family protein, partial [Pirellulaceae bacterium]